MSVVHVDATGAAKAHAAWVKRVAKRAMDMLVLPDMELGIRLVGTSQMTAMNLEWRGKDGPTDVLSFDGDGPYLGDVALCVPVARAQAKELGHSLDVELGVLTVHAVVHLCGLDHERSPAEAIHQAEVEMGVLDCLGLPVAAALSRRGF